MLREFSTRRVVSFILLDWLGTLAMLFLAIRLRIALGHLPPSVTGALQALNITYNQQWDQVAPTNILMPHVFVLVGLIWVVSLLAFGAYDGRHNETLQTELRNLFLAICAAMLTLAGILYFTYRETSRSLLLLFFMLDVAFLLGSRLLLAFYRRLKDPQARADRRAVLIVGAGAVGRNVLEQLRRLAWPGLWVSGYVDDAPGKQGQEIDGVPVLGTVDDLPGIVAANRVHDAVVALPLHAHERLVMVCKMLQKQGVRVHVVPDLFALSFPSTTLDGFGGIPVISLGQPGIYGWRRFWKRVFDVTLAGLSLVLAAPLMLIIAVLIRLESHGAAIYRQQRLGENGRLFTMLKFRSMCADADPMIHQAHVTRLIQENLSIEQLEGSKDTLKMADDPRVTRVGRFLRKTSLDELPQLWNVVRGEMSLVGPRPPIPYEVAVYKEWHMRRLEAIPGLTGLWQIKGRNQVSFDEMVRMDLEYIERQSLGLDIKILIQTPLHVLVGRGAG